MYNNTDGKGFDGMAAHSSSSPSSEPKKDQKGSESPETPGSIEVDNSSSILVKIATLYAEQLMSDINLVVGGNVYPAHRLILCATSEVFQVMLMNREWSEWSETAIELKETPQCVSVFPHFLRYFYTGQIRISQKTVLPVLSLADKYNVKDLVELCVCYMSRHLAHAVEHGFLVEWLQYTMACGHIEVAKACQNFVKWNLETLSDTSNFINFEPEVLISLLQQNDLVIHSEITLFNFVVKWIEHQKARMLAAEEEDLSKEEVDVHMEELVHASMSHIRFPMMTPRQLAELLLNPLTTAYKEFLVNRMAIAMSYHSGHTDRIKEIFATEEGKLLFTPRLYTEDRWSSMLTIENFHSLQCYHTRTFVFSAHSSLAEYAGDRTCEWVVDLYPKGVWFKKSLLIFWQGSCEVPEVVLRTVRLAVTCREPPKYAPRTHPFSIDDLYGVPSMRVKIGILISGIQWGIEHVMTVKERIFHFSDHQRVLNIDDVLDFDELNTPVYSPSFTSQFLQSNANSCCSKPGVSGSYYKKSCQCNKSSTCNKCVLGGSGFCSCSGPEPPANLVGPNRDQLKIQVVITPLTDVCCVTAPEFGFK